MFDVIKLEDGMKWAKDVKSCDTYKEVGINDSEAFLLPDDIIVVDIDDIEIDVMEEMLDRLKIKTMHTFTDEGMHLYYRVSSTYKYKSNGICPLGFEIEHKRGQITITHDGVVRDIYNEGVIEPLPFFFKLDKSVPDCYGMGDGSRYNTLLTLNGIYGNRSFKGDCLRFINDCVFEEPIDRKKLMSVLKSKLDDNREKKNEVRMDGVKSLFEMFQPVKYNGALYFKDENGNYDDDLTYLNTLLYKEVGDQGSTYVEEMKKQLEGRAEYIRGYNLFPIQFENGYTLNGEFHIGVYNGFTPYHISSFYNPEAKCPDELDKFLKFICGGDQDLIDYIFQAFGAALEVDPQYRNKEPRIHTFYGDGGNGKGFIMRLLGNALGKDHKTSVKIHKFGDKDLLVSLRGSLYNVGEDVKGSVLTDDILSMVKNIAAADEISVRKIYSEADNNVLIFPALFFTSNHYFPTYEKGKSVTRRFFWIPFKEELESAEWMTDEFVEKLYSDEAKDYIVKRIIEGHMDVRKNGFMKCEVVEEETRIYMMDNNNVEAFIETAEWEDFKGQKVSDCYELYKDWAEAEGGFVAGKSDFKNTVTTKFKKTTGSRKKKDPFSGRKISVECFVDHPKKKTKE